MPISATAAVRDLGEEVWAWRGAQRPRSPDDIPRMDRPPGWVPDWSPEAVAAARRRRDELVARWQDLDVGSQPVAVQVDRRLIGSVLARVRWELDILRSWQRDPSFYVDQTLGVVFDALLQPPPFDPTRADEVLRLLTSIPATLEAARANLDPVAAFARVAVDALAAVERQLPAAMTALAPLLPASTREPLAVATERATAALVAYRDWLAALLPELAGEAAVGRDAFLWFLRHVALQPMTPEEMVAAGRQEWHRAVALEQVLRARHRDVPVPPLFASTAAQVAAQRDAEAAVRAFCEERDLLSQPEDLRRYRFAALPDHLAPLAWLGVLDDLTSVARPHDDAVRYVPEPSEDLGFFDLANARDPRTGIVHEGVHAQQLALGYTHPDPLRRCYYDSGPNEGIAFYHEELLLQAGLFDDAPHSQLTIARFLRLRALRVEVDVRLATGDLDIAGAAALLAETVPMDVATAAEEAAFFAATPGQALTYQIGKLQIVRLVSDAARVRGGAFRLRALHDELWRNGNVPLSLLRWELLGLRDEVDALDAPPDR